MILVTEPFTQIRLKPEEIWGIRIADNDLAGFELTGSKHDELW